MNPAVEGVSRTDQRVSGEPGVEIFVREVRGISPTGRPLLLVHGGGPGGIASFDLPVPGYSVAADLAAVGHVVYLMDVRGWGASTRPPALSRPASEHPPCVRSEEVVRDIGAVIDAVRAAHHGRSVALLGWATGGHWCATYAVDHAESVSHLVMLNSLYGVNAPWGLRAAFEAQDRSGEFDRHAGAYSSRTGAGLLGRWDRSIPFADKAGWRDPRVAEAYVTAALASDPLSATHSPPAMRTPNGFQLESYEMSRGWRPWQAADIRVPSLVVRGERDFWSRPDDFEAVQRELANAPRVHAVTIPGATHYVFNDRPERGRKPFLDEGAAFLAAD